MRYRMSFCMLFALIFGIVFSVVASANVNIDETSQNSEYIIVYNDGSYELITTNPQTKNKMAKVVSRDYINKKSNIEYVQKNVTYEAFVTPNDQYFRQQVNLLNDGSGLSMENVWDKCFGNSNNVVAVIDTGVDINHIDLKSNIFVNSKEIPDNYKDDDGNGFVDDVSGWNGRTNTGQVLDDNGHGTHCAGIIGATSNNGIGITGINWNVKILPIKFLGKDGSGDTYSLVKGIDYILKLKSSGINIIAVNCSFGSSSYDQLMETYLRKLSDAGITIVCAAGNEGLNIDNTPVYPAVLDIRNLISVAAVDKYGCLPTFSNYGKKNVDVAAPGVSIISTYPGNTLAFASGTSMATPHITGMVALLKAIYPAYTMDQITALICNSNSSVPSSVLANKIGSGGYINMSRVMYGGNIPNITPTPYVTITPTPYYRPTPTPVRVTPTPYVRITPTPYYRPTPTPYYRVTPTPTVTIINMTPIRPVSMLNTRKVVFEWKLTPKNNYVTYLYFSDYAYGTYPVVRLYNKTSYTFPWSVRPGNYKWRIGVVLPNGKEVFSNWIQFSISATARRATETGDVGTFDVVDMNGNDVIPILSSDIDVVDDVNSGDITNSDFAGGGCNQFGPMGLMFVIPIILATVKAK